MNINIFPKYIVSFITLFSNFCLMKLLLIMEFNELVNFIRGVDISIFISLLCILVLPNRISNSI